MTSDKRVSALPDVPTMAEVLVPGFNSISWIGLLAPAGTPRGLVEKISADVRALLDTDDTRERFIELGAIPMGSTPEQFAQLIDKDRKRYEQIIREHKISAN